MNLRRLAFAATLAVATFAPRIARAGPPFVTDDPVPTDYRHWEIYTGVQYQNAGSGDTTASLPFAEFNYGALPNVQVSFSAPVEADSSAASNRFGLGDTEFGVKGRVVQETSHVPQISIYPSIAIPATRGEHVVTLLPVWLQKSAGPWTAFGGGGISFNPGPGQRDYSFLGTAVERALSPATSVGAELYHQGASTIGGSDTTAANLGATAQIGAYHAVLFSAGRAFHGPNTFSAYASYEYELGPGGVREP